MTDSPHRRPSPIYLENGEDSREEMSNAPMEPVTSIDGIRNSVNQLAGSDRLDKDSALTMTRLFHAMETLLRQECTQRDAQISRMGCEIERTRIQHELDRIASSQIIQQQQQQTVDSTPLRRAKSKW